MTELGDGLVKGLSELLGLRMSPGHERPDERQNRLIAGAIEIADNGDRDDRDE